MAITIDEVWVGGDTGNEDDWGTAANWSTGVPVANDGVAIPDGNTNAIAAYDNTAVALDSIDVRRGYNQGIGSITDGIGSYLQLDLGGTGDGVANLAGGGVCLYDIDNATSINVDYAGLGSSITRTPATYIKGLDNDAVNIGCGSGSSVGLCWLDGEVLETDALTIVSGTVYIGRGLVKKDGSTAVDITVKGGTVYCWSPVGTLTMSGGAQFYHYAEGSSLATLDFKNSTYTPMRSMTIGTALTSNSTGIFDLEQGKGTVTITPEATVEQGFKIMDANDRLASGAVFKYASGLNEPGLKTGLSKKITISDI